MFRCECFIINCLSRLKVNYKTLTPKPQFLTHGNTGFHTHIHTRTHTRTHTHTQTHTHTVIPSLPVSVSFLTNRQRNVDYSNCFSLLWGDTHDFQTDTNRLVIVSHLW